MGNNFDFNSKKYMILLILICLVFAIFIIKAFDYLPDTDVYDANNEEVENINTPTSNVNMQTSVNNNVNKKPVQKSGVLYKSPDSLSDDNDMMFDEIDAPNGVNETIPNESISETPNNQLSPDELALKSILNAKKYDKNNTQASLDEYKKALSLATDDEIKAEAYDGIAILYAQNKKYSTALSFASKANNISPSFSREFLIAKIYYSAGKSDIAIKAINDILRKGFRN